MPIHPDRRLSCLVIAVAALGCESEMEPPPEVSSIEAVGDHFCSSIHAVLIARAERLGNCTANTIAATPTSDLGAGCAGMTADQCAAEHYANPTAYTRSGSGSFDLHYLPETSALRCADGTKPHYYFSPGTDATKWIIYQNGGSGKCGRRKDRLGNYVEAGENCLERYVMGDGNSGFGRRARWEGDGILDGSTLDENGELVNADFHTWNRVWIPSCSNDQYQGSADHPSELVLHTTNRDWYAPLYSHGLDIVKAVIDDLASGAVSMDLSDSTLVMIYGSSGGASGLQMTLDAKAAHVATVTSARVVGLLDASAEPNISGAEGLFDNNPCSSIYAADCPTGYNAPPIGRDITAGFDFDTSAYQVPDPITCPGCGTARVTTEWWGDNLDASCVAHHPTSIEACYDGYHVAYHHTATPVFHATSLRDRNQYNNPIEYVTVAEGDSVTFQSLETTNCGALPRERVTQQLIAYQTYRDGAGGAHGESHGAGPIGVWAIDWIDHEITKESGIFNDATLDGTTLSAAILDWAVNETPVFLLEASGYATRTADPTSPEKVLECPMP